LSAFQRFWRTGTLRFVQWAYSPVTHSRGTESARNVARAFSRPCRHSCRHVFDRFLKGLPMALRAVKSDEDALDGSTHACRVEALRAAPRCERCEKSGLTSACPRSVSVSLPTLQGLERKCSPAASPVSFPRAPEDDSLVPSSSSRRSPPRHGCTVSAYWHLWATLFRRSGFPP
jgi:hypothetical protein